MNGYSIASKKLQCHGRGASKCQLSMIVLWLVAPVMSTSENNIAAAAVSSIRVIMLHSEVQYSMPCQFLSMEPFHAVLAYHCTLLSFTSTNTSHIFSLCSLSYVHLITTKFSLFIMFIGCLSFQINSLIQYPKMTQKVTPFIPSHSITESSHIPSCYLKQAITYPVLITLTQNPCKYTNNRAHASVGTCNRHNQTPPVHVHHV